MSSLLKSTTMLTKPLTMEDLFFSTAAPTSTTKAGKKPVDLNSPDKVKELGMKYAKFHDNMDSILESIFHAGAYLWSVFSSRTFTDVGGSMPPAVKDEATALKSIWYPMSNFNDYLAIRGDVIETKINLKPIPMRVTYPSPTNDLTAERVKLAEQTVQLFIPSFSFPDKWKKAEGEFKQDTVVPVWTSSTSGTRISLEKLKTLKVPKYDPPNNVAEDYRVYDHYEGYTKNFGGMVELRLSVNTKGSQVNTYRTLDDNGGTLKGSNLTINFDIEVEAFIKWPAEYAMYATSSSGPKTFVPFLFSNFVDAIKKEYCNTEGFQNQPARRISSIESIRAAVQERVRAQKLNIKPRGNEDDLVILRSGRIVWIPRGSDNIDKYNQLLRNSFDAKESKVAQPAKIEGLSNMPLYTDWLFNYFSYTDTKGEVRMTNLRGAIPMDDVTINRYMMFSINSDFFRGNMKEVINEVEKQNLQVNTGNKDGVRYLETFEACYTTLLRYAPDLMMSKLAVGDLRDAVDDQAQYKVAMAAAAFIMQTMFKMWETWDKLTFPFDVQSTDMRFFFLLLCKYGSAKLGPRFKSAYDDAVRRHSQSGVTVPDKFEVPNCPGLEERGFMPHQANVIAQQDTDPDCIMQDIQPGGGKTILIIVKALRLIERMKAKRPLVIVPGGLVREFISEINKISQGRINAFPLRQTTLDRLKNTLGWSREQIISYIKAAPINTIFVGDYSMLVGKRDIDSDERIETITYYNKEVQFYPNIMFLRECEFDIIDLDESHKVKNLTAQRTSATADVISLAKYKGLSSGTTIFDTPTDLVGQASMFNPNIFGTTQSFKENVYVSSDPKKGMLDNAGQWINNALRPYVKKIVVKRSEWAYLLPKINEQFHNVDLTSEQYQFYVKLMDEAKEEILANPKLAKMLKENREEDADKIENELKRYLAKVEIFINAPDENKVFAEIAKGSRKDLMSPKMAKVNEILDAHFEGGTIGKGAEAVKVKASNGKVIIFGYNRAVSRHMMRYLRRANQAVHYYAGNDDAITQFRDNPNVKILVADEVSISEGNNLQVASRMIRLQTLWSPGAQEQALSRCFRPDVDNKYNRDSIDFDWILASRTIEIAKTARLISKMINKAHIDEGDNPAWRQVERDLNPEMIPLIKMNLDLIKQYQQFDDLNTHFVAYATYKEWEDRQFEVSISKLRAKVETKLGRKVSLSELRAKASTPVSGQKMLPNSKSIYVPWVEGAKPSDKWQLGLTPVTLVEAAVASNSDSDDEEEGSESFESDTLEVSEGDVCVTEFGPGKIKTVRSKSLVVTIPGFGNAILPKTLVFIPGEAKNVKKLKDILDKAGPNGLPFLNMKAKGVIEDDEKNLPVSDKKGAVPAPKTTAPGKKDDKIYLEAATMNGMIAMYATAEDDDVSLLVNIGYRHFGAFWSIPVDTYAGGVKLLATLEKKFSIPPENVSLIKTMLARLKSGQKSMAQTGPTKFSDIKNFFLLNSKPNKFPKTLKIWPMVWDNELYFGANIKIQPTAFAKLKGITGIGGVGKGFREEEIAIKFYPSKEAALTDLKRISKMVTVTNLEEVKEYINEAKLWKKK